MTTMHSRAIMQAAAAFRQAMDELGVPEHPNGECPTPDCTCVAVAPLVEVRAYELLRLPIPGDLLR
jgi:hypothetical protein